MTVASGKQNGAESIKKIQGKIHRRRSILGQTTITVDDDYCENKCAQYTNNGEYDKKNSKKKNATHESISELPMARGPVLSVPAATAAAAPSAMLAAVSGAITASVTASVAAAAAAAAITVVAALPRGVPLPASPLSTVLGVETAAIAHPCPLVKTPLVAAAAGASAAPRAAVSSFPPGLTPLGWEAASAAVSASTIASTVAASSALAQRAAGGSSIASVAVTPGALPSWRMRSLARRG